MSRGSRTRREARGEKKRSRRLKANRKQTNEGKGGSPSPRSPALLKR